MGEIDPRGIIRSYFDDTILDDLVAFFDAKENYLLIGLPPLPSEADLASYVVNVYKKNVDPYEAQDAYIKTYVALPRVERKVLLEFAEDPCLEEDMFDYDCKHPLLVFEQGDETKLETKRFFDTLQPPCAAGCPDYRAVFLIPEERVEEYQGYLRGARVIHVPAPSKEDVAKAFGHPGDNYLEGKLASLVSTGTIDEMLCRLNETISFKKPWIDFINALILFGEERFFPVNLFEFWKRRFGSEALDLSEDEFYAELDKLDEVYRNMYGNACHYFHFGFRHPEYKERMKECLRGLLGSQSFHLIITTHYIENAKDVDAIDAHFFFKSLLNLPPDLLCKTLSRFHKQALYADTKSFSLAMKKRFGKDPNAVREFVFNQLAISPNEDDFAVFLYYLAAFLENNPECQSVELSSVCLEMISFYPGYPNIKEPLVAEGFLPHLLYLFQNGQRELKEDIVTLLLAPITPFEPSHEHYAYLISVLPYFDDVDPKKKEALQLEHLHFADRAKLYRFAISYRLVVFLGRRGVFLIDNE